MSDLKVYDIEFSDIGIQGGHGEDEDTIQLTKKPTEYELNSDDDDDDDDDESDNQSYKDGEADEDDDDDGGDDDDDDNDDDDDDDEDEDDDGRGGDRDDDADADNGVGQLGSDDDEDIQVDDAGEMTDDEGDDTAENFKKFNQQLKMSYVADTHPEAESHNDDDVHAFAKVVRDAHGVIIDPLHKTIPILTKYEKTRILGMRTKQLNDGAEPYIKLPVTPVPIIDGYVIAQRELEEKKLPFINRRPLPNGGTEYWYLQDLEIL
jgi:DNA-directed RNA polymerase subunit K/omega